LDWVLLSNIVGSNARLVVMVSECPPTWELGVRGLHYAVNRAGSPQGRMDG